VTRISEENTGKNSFYVLRDYKRLNMFT